MLLMAAANRAAINSRPVGRDAVGDEVWQYVVAVFGRFHLPAKRLASAAASGEPLPPGDLLDQLGRLGQAQILKLPVPDNRKTKSSR